MAPSTLAAPLPSLTSDPDADAARARLQRAAGDDFEVGELIGRGGFADVFRATDRRLKRSVALKVLRADARATPDVLDRFRREAESIAALRHPHILPIHGIGERDDVVYLVLDWVDGESLGHWLAREPRLEIHTAARVLCEVTAALAAAHRAGIVHRDVKPANVLLDGPERRVLLGDFGIARVMGAEDLALTRTGTFVGSPHYLSPEQAAGDAADHRADLYSLGVLGYRIVTGVLPFEGATAAVLVQHLTRTPLPIRELRDDCPQWLADTLHRCLAKSADERWPSADGLLAALDAGADGRAAAARAAYATGGPGEGHEPASDAAGFEATASRFRRVVAGNGALALGVLVLDLAFTGTLTISALVLLATAAAIAMAGARVWIAGFEPLDLLRRGRMPVAPDPSTEEFGRHAAVVRRAHRERTSIVRALADLTSLERGRLGALAPAADHLVGRITRLARRMSALDERIGAERADGARRAAARPARMIEEMLVSRARLEAELAESERVLARLGEVAERASSADATALHAEMDAALAEADRCGRGAEGTADQPI